MDINALISPKNGEAGLFRQGLEQASDGKMFDFRNG